MNPLDLLESERRLVLSRLAALTGDFDEVVAASRDTNADDEHDPEGATIAFERSQVAALVQQARTHLAEVDRALERLADGTYGTWRYGLGKRVSDVPTLLTQAAQ